MCVRESEEEERKYRVLTYSNLSVVDGTGPWLDLFGVVGVLHWRADQGSKGRRSNGSGTHGLASRE